MLPSVVNVASIYLCTHLFYVAIENMWTPPQQYDIVFKRRLATPNFPQWGTKVRRGKDILYLN